MTKGFVTSEFFGVVAAMIVVVLTAVGDVFPDKKLGAVCAAAAVGLAGLYSFNRTSLKKAEIRSGNGNGAARDPDPEASLPPSTVRIPMPPTRPPRDVVDLPLTLPDGRVLVRGQDGGLVIALPAVKP